MGKRAYTDEQFIETWKILNSPAAVAKALNVDVRTVHERRLALEGCGLADCGGEGKYAVE